MQILCFFLFFFYSRAAVSVVFSTLLSCSGFIVYFFASCIFIWTNKDDDDDDDLSADSQVSLRHQSTLQWWATRFLPPLAEVISDRQHAVIWQYLDHERRLTDKEVFLSLVRHCGTRCRSLFVTYTVRSSAHILVLRLFFCFASVFLSLSVFPFSLYYVVMSCMYIIIGCQLWWTFLSGSLPLLYYFKVIATLYLLLANKISDLIWSEDFSVSPSILYLA